MYIEPDQPPEVQMAEGLYRLKCFIVGYNLNSGVL